MNFAEFPMALLSERSPEGKTELVFCDSVRDQSTGEVVVRKVTITAPPKYGLPTVKDEEVLLGLLAITKQKNNFGECTVHFSRRELISLLGWNDQGYSYQRLIESLERWASVFFKYENGWWDNLRKEWVDISFHVVNSVRVNKPTKNPGSGKVVIEWGKEAFDSFQSNYLKQLNLAFYQALDLAVSKRLFRYLDKHFYHRARLEYDLLTLAFEHVGLSRDYEPWKVKQKLAPAIAELEAKGFLEKLAPKERFLAAGKGKWKVVFVRKRLALAAQPAEELVEIIPPLVGKLTERGVSAKTAKELVGKWPADRIEKHLEAFDWLVSKKDRRISKSPSGFLVKAIEDDFAMPAGFEPDCVKRRRVEEGKRKNTDEMLKRRTADEKAKVEEANRRKQIDDFLVSLAPSDRERFAASAIENGHPFMTERYHRALDEQNQLVAENYRYLLLEQAIKELSAQKTPA